MSVLDPKDPDAIKSYPIDLSAWFTKFGESGFSSTSGKEPTATVVSGGITFVSLTIGDQSLTPVISGGTAGQTAELRLEWWGDSDALTDQLSLMIQIQERANQVS